MSEPTPGPDHSGTPQNSSDGDVEPDPSSEESTPCRQQASEQLVSAHSPPEDKAVDYEKLTTIDPEDVRIIPDSDRWKNDTERSVAELVNCRPTERLFARQAINAVLVGDLRYARRRHQFPDRKAAIKTAAVDTAAAVEPQESLQDAIGGEVGHRELLMGVALWYAECGAAAER